MEGRGSITYRSADGTVEGYADDGQLHRFKQLTEGLDAPADAAVFKAIHEALGQGAEGS